MKNFNLSEIDLENEQDDFNEKLFDTNHAEDFFSNQAFNLSDALRPALEENNFDLQKDFEGQLAVDVFQTPYAIVIKAAVAGVNPEDLDISIHNDMLTIRGKREMEEEINEQDYFYKECFWGGFSRSIILPTDVLVDKIQANFKNGVLTIILPKAEDKKRIDINIE